MKLINNIVVGLMLSIVVLFATSCSESLSEINTSPNDLPHNEVDVKYVLAGIITNSAQISTAVIYEWGELSAATQYLQRDMTSYEENNYEWASKGFSNYYEPIKDSHYIFDRVETEKEGEEKDFYQAVALIMKSYWYGFLTSAYGDIPYSNAMQAEKGGDEFFKPVYDEQKDVFLGVINDLKNANELLKGVGVCQQAVDADVMYNGNALKWRKFANSLRLRYYMRLSEKTGIEINPSSEIATIVGDANQFPIMTGNDDNAAVAFVGTDKVNSWPGGPLDFSFRSEFYRRKPSATIVDQLISLNDPRLTTWVKPVDVQIVQGTTNEIVIENGSVKRYVDINIENINSDGNKENNINTALYVGLPIALTAPNDFNLGGTVNDFRDKISELDGNIYLSMASNPHTSYLTDMYAENSNSLVKSVFMNCAEVKFLLSEACSRGWVSDDAYVYFKSGIEKSFEQYNIADGDVSSVYDKTNNTLVAFDKDAYIANAKAIYDNASVKLEPILSQKWIALWMTSESWFDWRRTGIPDLNNNIISGTNGQKTPIRFWYEDIYNEDNMVNAINKLEPATNDQWSKMWLLR